MTESVDQKECSLDTQEIVVQMETFCASVSAVGFDPRYAYALGRLI